MDFLGIGPLELLVVLIIALIVVGPERLPEIAQSIGKILRDLRTMSQGFAADWQQELNSLPRIEPGEKTLQQSLTAPLKEAQAEFQQALSAPLTSPSQVAAEPAPLEAPPAESNTTENDDTDNANT